MLDESQEQVVQSEERIFSVLAGAGAGKTRVVCERARWLVENGTDPSNVVIFTFTKKAAGEIQERLEDIPGIIAGTFHSILLQWIKAASPEMSGMKYGVNGLATQSEVESCEKVTGKLFDRRMASELQSISFDMIIELGFELIMRDPSITKDTHFIIDESQDNSEEQWDVVNAIASCEGMASLMVVGDLRQSIYEWRGAKPEMGKVFASRRKSYHLAKNYRCGDAIVRHANRVISVGGFEEPMIPASEIEGSIEFIQATNVGQSLCGKIEEFALDGREYGEIAVIARLNGQADDIANHLQQEGIPCYRKNPSWNSAMDRLCAWATFISNPHNPIAWSVAVGDSIRLTDKKVLVAESQSTGTSLLDLMLIKGVEGFPIDKQIPAMDDDTIRKLWTYCGGADDFADSICQRFSGVRCADFAETLCIDGTPEGEGVTVGTIHSVKGLEFDVVFFLHCAQRIMPGPKQGRKKEEERRLVFVGATRARSNLVYMNFKHEEWSEFILDDEGRFLL